MTIILASPNTMELFADNLQYEFSKESNDSIIVEATLESCTKLNITKNGYFAYVFDGAVYEYILYIIFPIIKKYEKGIPFDHKEMKSILNIIDVEYKSSLFIMTYRNIYYVDLSADNKSIQILRHTFSNARIGTEARPYVMLYEAFNLPPKMIMECLLSGGASWNTTQYSVVSNKILTPIQIPHQLEHCIKL